MCWIDYKGAGPGLILASIDCKQTHGEALLNAGIVVDKFIVIDVPDEILIERGRDRRIDPESGEMYHLKFKPPPAEIVDRLVRRSDDHEKVIRQRLASYHDEIHRILPLFGDVVTRIDGTPNADDVAKLIGSIFQV